MLGRFRILLIKDNFLKSKGNDFFNDFYYIGLQVIIGKFEDEGKYFLILDVKKLLGCY